MPGSYAILFFAASDFTFTTRLHQTHPQLRAISAWPGLFVLSGAVSNSSLSPPGAYWTASDLRGPSSGVISFYLFIQFVGFSRQEFRGRLPYPLLVGHILSVLFTMTSPSWVALQSLAHNFTELHKPFRHDKAVIHEGEG